MAVPFIDLKRYEDSFLPAWQDKLTAMSARAEFIGGPEVAALEEALKARLGVGHAISCANGTDAIQLALRAIGVGRGDRVLVPDLTFWATFEAVVNVGADPVTLDIAPTDGGIDIAMLEQAIDLHAPKAAVIAHLYGWGSARLADIRALCAQKGVLLVEDGAQCFGTEFEGRSIYAGALISTTSFYPAKVLGAAGDGGAVFTDEAALAERVRQLSNHGRTMHYGFGEVGWNSRMDALQAAFLNLSLSFIDQRIDSRRRAAEIYRQQLGGLPLRVMAVPSGYRENAYCNVCHLSPADRARLEAALKAAQIGFGNIYPGAMSAQKGAEKYLAGRVGGEHAAAFCASVLNLPLFPYMREEELAAVVHAVRSVFA